MSNSKVKYIIFFGCSLLFCCLVVILFFSIPPNSKRLFIFRKYYLHRMVKWPSYYNGIWCEWDVEGNLLKISEIRNGLLNGETKYFDPSKKGILIGRENYRNGNLYGKQEFYNYYGKLYRVCDWKEGYLNAQMIWYYENGKEMINCFFQKGAFNGEFNYHYENGNKKLNGYIDYNKPINEWIYWKDYNDATNGILNANSIEDFKIIINLILEAPGMTTDDLSPIVKRKNLTR